MSTPDREPSEEEMRAAYEAELKRITITDVVIQAAVSLINLGGRRLGVSPGAEDERDLEQVRDAIDAVRGMVPVLERRSPSELRPLRDALAQLQMAYARQAAAAKEGHAAQPAAAATPEGGAPPAAEQAGTGAKPPTGADSAGPAVSSGRLWVPGR